jgi:hypothetical protein
VPQQYLFLLNSSFMQQRAKSFAARITKEFAEDASRIERAYQILYQRSPTDNELVLGCDFLNAAGNDHAQRQLRWEQYSQVLLGSNELMYLP